jgi:hypothetical protein
MAESDDPNREMVDVVVCSCSYSFPLSIGKDDEIAGTEPTTAAAEAEAEGSGAATSVVAKLLNGVRDSISAPIFVDEEELLDTVACTPCALSIAVWNCKALAATASEHNRDRSCAAVFVEEDATLLLTMAVAAVAAIVVAGLLVLTPTS